MKKTILIVILLVVQSSFSQIIMTSFQGVMSSKKAVVVSIALVPGYPTITDATAGNTEATVSFTAPTSDGGSAITGYTVTSLPVGFTATGLSSPLVVTGLNNGTPYTFTVVATNAAGNSVASAVSNAVTPAAAVCGAYVSAGVWKEFACHNLGADTALDPNTPVQGIHGNYYQWGIKNHVADASTAAGVISGWNTTAAANDAWTDGSKTTNDPCPTGFRVPTNVEWNGVIANNTVSRTGTWVNDGNFSTAIHWGPNNSTKTLTLPAAGYRSSIEGTLGFRAYFGYYWSSTEYGTKAWNLYFNSSYADTYYNHRPFGFSVRCVSE